jgi:MFS family permease
MQTLFTERCHHLNSMATSQIQKPPQADTSRNIYIFGFTSLLNDTASEMAYWLLPAFLITLGAGPQQLGVIEGIAESVAAGAKLFSGYLADRVPRRKPLVVAGYVIANVVKPLLAVTTSWVQVLFIRFADRTAKGIRGAPRDVMLAESVNPKKMGAAFGLMQSMDSAGAILGPLLALWIVGQAGVRGVFWAAAVPGLLSVVVVSFFAKETKSNQAETKDRQLITPLTFGAAALPASFYYVLAVVTLFSIGNSSDMFLILRAQDAGIDVRYAPLLGLVFNLTYTFASWPAGKLSDRVQKNLVAAAGYLVFAVTYFVFAKAPSQRALWLTMAGYGLFYALTNPVLRALVVERVAPESRGSALGIFYFATSIATLLASVVAGYLWRNFGAASTFHLSAALAFVCALLLVLNPAASMRGTQQVS